MPKARFPSEQFIALRCKYIKQDFHLSQKALSKSTYSVSSTNFNQSSIYSKRLHSFNLRISDNASQWTHSKNMKKTQSFAYSVQRHGQPKSNKLDIIKSATNSTTSQLLSLINLYFLPCVSIIIRPIVFDPLFETCPNSLKLTLFRSLTFLETDHLIFADGNISEARLLAKCMFMSKRDVQSLLNFYCFIFSEVLNYSKVGIILIF